MGVDILSRQVTLSGCLSSECKTWSNANATPTITNSVKRSLFGPVDHNEAMSFFQKELAKMEEEKKLKWNFDFTNEKPLKGRFKWEKVDNSKSCKSRSPHKVTKCRGKRSPLKNKLNNVDVCVKTKQSSITDYLEISKSIVKQRTVKETISSYGETIKK